MNVREKLLERKVKQLQNKLEIKQATIQAYEGKTKEGLKLEESLSEQELKELSKHQQRIDEFKKAVIKGETKVLPSDEMKVKEEENKSFGEILADYSSKQKSKTNITDEMIKEWEKQW